ncbi:MAG: A/G-specific adenine glycosylase, partial [Puniceicoccales bacterium]
AVEWIHFPGVGPYTAAAISSIAFGDQTAVVDGNVVRILARLTADDTTFKDGSMAVKHFDELAQSLIQHASRPGPHNEAMMELGATVCLKNKPLCLLCPVQTLCAGNATGNPEAYPVLLRKAAIQRTVQRVWVELDGKLLLHRRAESERRLAGMYELPESDGLATKKQQTQPLAVKKRGIGNERIEERIYAIKASPKLKSAISGDEQYCWVAYEALDSVTLTGPHRKWITEILAKM